MLQPKTRWNVAPRKPDEAKRLAGETGASPLVAQLLLNRNIRTAEAAVRFLNIQKQPFYDPLTMRGMREAVERIRNAVKNGERILVFGDYDADGVTSTAVMMTALKEIGANADYYIPNRFAEGYGPNEPAFRRASENGYRLIVTVDTGISAVDEAAAAKELGMDLIITDHHQPPPVLPDAFSIVNPHQKGCMYPFKELSGAGVALKVAHALLHRIPEHLLDLAALGTIADLVPLIEENRLIARRGLDMLKNSDKPGIRALLQVAGIHTQKISEENVGFAIGPRLNAAGRIGSADPAVKLLLAEDPGEAEQLAKEIDRMNRERKNIVNEMTNEAIAEIEERFPVDDHHVLVIAKEGWNPGVIGIVASRLLERFHRPTIVMSIDPDTGLARGSARSISAFDIFKQLSICRDLLLHFGGHPMAAGMTVKTEHIDDLRIRLNEQAAEVLAPEDFIPMKEIDLTCKVGDISLEFIEDLQKLAPFGTGNPAPKVVIEEAPVTRLKPVGSEHDHLKAVFSEGGASLEGIGFGMGSLVHEIAAPAVASAAGELQINEWNGFRKPQLMVEDLAVFHWQLFDFRKGRGLHDRIGALPEDKCVFVAFRPQTVEHWDIVLRARSLIYMPEVASGKPDFNGRYVVLLDLPERKEHLQELFADSSVPERVYAVFAHEKEHFFSTIPTREHFKWFYGFLYKRQTFDLRKHAEKLAQAKGWSRETVTFMADVFCELGFVSIDDGVVSVFGQPAKRDLSDSMLYRGKQQQAQLENDLCYSSYSSLKQWFNQIIGRPKILEEAAK